MSVADRDRLLRDGCQLQHQGRWTEALACFEAAVRLAPHDLQTLLQLGFLLIQGKEWRRAAETYERIAPLLPRDHRVWCNLSYLYEHCGEFTLAEDRARKAIRLAPNCGEAWNNLGMALRGRHQFAAAVQAFQQAIERQPSLAVAEFNRATTYLLVGDGERGWPGYEARRHLAEARLRTCTAPLWNGEVLAGKSLLVYADQGVGDTLQFARYLPEAARRSQADVVLSAPRELLPVLQGVDGAARVVAMDAEPYDCAAEVAIASLPGLFRASLSEPPAAPYLKPTIPDLRPPIAQLIKDVVPGTLRVGLVWQGNPTQSHDYVRSVALSRLISLADVPGVTWLSLQVGTYGRSQLPDVADRWRLIDVGERLEDFGDTAAVMQHLDLVITVDTSVAHLAGALGRSVWTMLGHTPDWRWGVSGTSCPWYPSMRLFRQMRWGDWDFVVAQVKQALIDKRRAS